MEKKEEAVKQEIEGVEDGGKAGQGGHNDEGGERKISHNGKTGKGNGDYGIGKPFAQQGEEGQCLAQSSLQGIGRANCEEVTSTSAHI